jgi:histidinol-phosphate aminotransferase
VAIQQAIQVAIAKQADITYQDAYQQLAQALASSLSVASEQIVLGTGSVDIIKAAVFGLIPSTTGDKPAMPTVAMLAAHMPFAMYPFEAQKRPVPFTTIPLLPDYQVDVPALCQAITTMGPGLVVLENPRNPSGTAIADITPVIEALQPNQVLLLDEAYDDFMRQECATTSTGWVEGTQLLARYPDKAILVQRTFSKSFALAACRVGYAFGSAALVSKVKQAMLPNPVDKLSLLAAHAVFTHPDTARMACPNRQAKPNA